MKLRLPLGGVVVAIVLATVTALPANAALPSWPNLVRGNTGPNVTTAQFLLQFQGYSIAADGSFGTNTYNAARSFQSSHGLSVDGEIGPQTWGALTITLSRGATNDAVRGLQVQLNRYGYGLSVDGDFGGMTDGAVRSFQSSHGLAAGSVGAQTWQSLVGGTPTVSTCSDGGCTGLNPASTNCPNLTYTPHWDYWDYSGGPDPYYGHELILSRTCNAYWGRFVRRDCAILGQAGYLLKIQQDLQTPYGWYPNIVYYADVPSTWYPGFNCDSVVTTKMIGSQSGARYTSCRYYYTDSRPDPAALSSSDWTCLDWSYA